jgi:hypothetical protein
LKLDVAGGLRKNSAGKNVLFFYLFDVFDFSQNSGRLTVSRQIQLDAINSKTYQKKAEEAEKA